MPRSNILGVGVSPINLARALQVIGGWVEQQGQHYVCVSGVHGIMESRRDPALRRIHNSAGLVTPDGMPLVWLSRLSGFADVGRVYGPDLLIACCEQFLDRGYRHYFYGGAPGVPELLIARLQRRFPDLAVAGYYSPPFGTLTAEEDRGITDRINAARPDIVWVGLSTPKQERWMADHVGTVQAAALLGIGAAFDFHAGVKRQAPRWMQRSGLEWLFRLATEPRRLWRRYLVNNPLFIWHVVMQAIGRAGYDLD